jgi:hypothetical protein
MPVIPSVARNLALLQKQCEIPRFARNDKVVSWFLGAAGGMSDCFIELETPTRLAYALAERKS